MTYRDKFLNLKSKLEQRGFHVRFVSSKTLGDYAGMNPKAAKAFGYSCPKNTFQIDSGMDWKRRYSTLVHEAKEYSKMKGGWKYWKAHRYASENEYQVGGACSR